MQIVDASEKRYVTRKVFGVSVGQRGMEWLSLKGGWMGGCRFLLVPPNHSHMPNNTHTHTLTDTDVSSFCVSLHNSQAAEEC